MMRTQLPWHLARVGWRCALFTALTGCVAPSGNATSPGGADFGKGLPKIAATPQGQAQEHQMFLRLNRDRADHGLPGLKYDERLANIGRAHSADMHEHGFFDHHSPTYGDLESRVDRAGYRNRVARENLAEGPTVDSAEDSLLKSPHHFENIMAADITHVGIGIVHGGVHDPRNLTITQVFAYPVRHESMADVRVGVQKAIARARQEKNLPPAKLNSRLTQYAEEYLRGSLDDVSDPDVKAISQDVAKRLMKEPIVDVHGVSAGGQVMVESSQFQVPAALLRENRRPYGFAVGEAHPPNKRPMLKVIVIVGL